MYGKRPPEGCWNKAKYLQEQASIAYRNHKNNGGTTPWIEFRREYMHAHKNDSGEWYRYVIQVCGIICRVDTTYDHQNLITLTVKDTIDDYKVTLFRDHLSLISKLLGDEGTGVLTDCEYLDIDRSNMKELKNSLLWRRNRR